MKLQKKTKTKNENQRLRCLVFVMVYTYSPMVDISYVLCCNSGSIPQAAGTFIFYPSNPSHIRKNFLPTNIDELKMKLTKHLAH